MKNFKKCSYSQRNYLVFWKSILIAHVFIARVSYDVLIANVLIARVDCTYAIVPLAALMFVDSTTGLLSLGTDA